MKEVTYEEWQKNPTPRLMWVWSYDEDNKVQQKVIYVLKAGVYENPVLTVADESTYECYKHCAEIEKTRRMTRRMTNKELSRWLRGNPTREYKYFYADDSDNSFVHYPYSYGENCADDEISERILIREDDGEWREPLVEVEK